MFAVFNVDLVYTHEMHETQTISFFVSLCFFSPIVLCKDSWEDFTELVEQMQMLDEFKGAYRGIASSLHSRSSCVKLPSKPRPLVSFSLAISPHQLEFFLPVSVMLVRCLSFCLF